jgi:hypothetical protein
MAFTASAEYEKNVMYLATGAPPLLVNASSNLSDCWTGCVENFRGRAATGPEIATIVSVTVGGQGSFAAGTTGGVDAGRFVSWLVRFSWTADL